MHPHHGYYHYYRTRRGPSRLLWFFIGAGTAAVWIKHKQAADIHGKFYWKTLPAPPVRETTTESKLAAWRRQCDSPQAEEEWEMEKERMATFGRQAQDAMTDISEATLDSLLNTCAALKHVSTTLSMINKLVQHREQRERELEDRPRSDKTT
ncbi:hypothetical protein BDZ89DRAFT_1032465 [Hymenopellis radicata]|nr:hypothetical protein BDZ89DRAFT_1032465 [Hymenopellis radicata]